MNRRPQSTFWESRELDRIHYEKRIRKIERIRGLRAILEMWEERPDKVEHDYLLALRARLRSAENQLAAMQI